MALIVNKNIDWIRLGILITGWIVPAWLTTLISGYLKNKAVGRTSLMDHAHLFFINNVRAYSWCLYANQHFWWDLWHWCGQGDRGSHPRHYLHDSSIQFRCQHRYGLLSPIPVGHDSRFHVESVLERCQDCSSGQIHLHVLNVPQWHQGLRTYSLRQIMMTLRHLGENCQLVTEMASRTLALPAVARFTPRINATEEEDPAVPNQPESPEVDIEMPSLESIGYQQSDNDDQIIQRMVQSFREDNVEAELPNAVISWISFIWSNLISEQRLLVSFNKYFWKSKTNHEINSEPIDWKLS